MYNRHRVENGINLPTDAALAAKLGLPQHNGSHTKYSNMVKANLRVLDEDFANGIFKNNDRLLLERVQSLENQMRANVLTIKGRVN